MANSIARSYAKASKTVRETDSMQFLQSEYAEVMEITKLFSENLKRFRVKKDLTQQALANSAGVSVQSIRDLEAGRRNPSVTVIDDLAKSLKIDIYELLKPETVIDAPFKSEPVSIFAKKIMSVPDDIYELAQKVDLNDDAWDTVRSALEVAIEGRQARKMKES